MTEAKADVMRRPAEGHQGRLATREAGRSKDPPAQVCGGAQPCRHLESRLAAPGTESINLCSFRPPRLWHFAMTGPAS